MVLKTPGPGTYDPYPFLNDPSRKTEEAESYPDVRQTAFHGTSRLNPFERKKKEEVERIGNLPEPMFLSLTQEEQSQVWTHALAGRIEAKLERVGLRPQYSGGRASVLHSGSTESLRDLQPEACEAQFARNLPRCAWLRKHHASDRDLIESQAWMTEAAPSSTKTGAPEAVRNKKFNRFLSQRNYGKKEKLYSYSAWPKKEQGLGSVLAGFHMHWVYERDNYRRDVMHSWMADKKRSRWSSSSPPEVPLDSEASPKPKKPEVPVMIQPDNLEPGSRIAPVLAPLTIITPRCAKNNEAYQDDSD